MPRAELSADGTEWTIPARRYKSAHAHLIPLSLLARDVLAGVKVLQVGGKDIFRAPAEHHGDAPKEAEYHDGAPKEQERNQPDYEQDRHAGEGSNDGPKQDLDDRKMHLLAFPAVFSPLLSLSPFGFSLLS